MTNIKGCLEVVAAVDSRMGISDRVIPAGTVGYVTASRGDKWVVHWPFIEKTYKGDWRTGSHPKSDLKPTGNRG